MTGRLGSSVGTVICSKSVRTAVGCEAICSSRCISSSPFHQARKVFYQTTAIDFQRIYGYYLIKDTIQHKRYSLVFPTGGNFGGIIAAHTIVLLSPMACQISPLERGCIPDGHGNMSPCIDAGSCF